MGTERHVPWDLSDIPADCRLEPLAVQIDKANQSDWSSADKGSQTGEVVESLLRRCIENSIAPEVFEPGIFVLGQRHPHPERLLALKCPFEYRLQWYPCDFLLSYSPITSASLVTGEIPACCAATCRNISTLLPPHPLTCW